MSVQAVILAAGQGTRLRPITHRVPKPLIPFWGKPFISYLLDNMDGLVDEAIIVVGPGGEIRAQLGDRHGSLPLRYVTQPEALGTGDAAMRVRGLVRDPFLLLLGDTCVPRETIGQVMKAPGDVVLTVIEVDDPENHGGVDIDREMRVHGLWTGAATVDAGMIRTTTALFEMLERLPRVRGELRLLVGVNRMLEAGYDVRAVIMPGPWLQFGDHEELNGVLRVMRELRDGAAAPGASIDARTQSCTIENSVVFGPGELVNCTVRNSLVYCTGRVEGEKISDEMAVLGEPPHRPRSEPA